MVLVTQLKVILRNILTNFYIISRNKLQLLSNHEQKFQSKRDIYLSLPTKNPET
jgi:hypothetical protein